MSDTGNATLTFELGRTHADGRSEVLVKRGAELLHSHVFNLLNSTARAKFIEACQSKFPGLPPEEAAKTDALLLGLGDTAAKRRPGDAGSSQPRSRAELERARDVASDAALEAMSEEVVAQAERLLADPQLIDCIQSDLGKSGIVGEEPLRLSAYILGTSRKLDDPLAGIVLGPSSVGKSFVIETTADLFPVEDVLRATDLTPNALYYVTEDRLVHTFVVAGERSRLKDDERAEVTRALREVISARVLHKVVPRKSESGPMVTETITRHGPIAFIESTTLTKIFNEDKNRALLLAADESPEQTRRVIECAALRASEGPQDKTSLLQLHHAMQRLLRRVGVRIPFAEAIGDQMPFNRPEARRAIGHTLSVIKAVALLHQRQRQRSPKGSQLVHGATIEATLDDYAIARGLLLGPLGQLLGSDLTPAITNFGQRVVLRWRGQRFTAAQAAAADDTIKDADACRRYLAALEAVGVVGIINEGRGGKPNVYEVRGDVPEPGAIWLPEVAALRAAGVDRLSAVGLPAGPSGRQLANLERTADPAAETTKVWRPASALRLGTPGRQQVSGRDEQDALATSRNAGDQTGRSPAEGADDRGDQGGSAPRVADDQPGPPENGTRGQTAPDLAVADRAEAAIRRALDAEDEGAVWFAVAELAGLIGQDQADAIEDELRAERRATVHAG